ncbi:UDP-glucose 4-epimerase GalE [Mycetocola miduiensis]|uniref:UDP-glucose 4-epimerase n=1 Tax=Mycetocola miduiensis TaxID=995034 RepID=A0A1I4YCJ5_9MICO|nr:UDP-glucose 4-epimerase GalE [Mycetocola miduiensis]SFN35775.1 UDP-glucose 4-epimerase [Mycetocola miduiensis]
MRVLLTGGAGYIGSHTAVELLQSGHEVTVLDSLVNSNVESIRRVEQITGRSVTLHIGDLTDPAQVEKVFAQETVDAVVHFAGLKSVAESVSQPLEYYRNNIDSTLVLLDAMARWDVKDLVFSSSATVYEPDGSNPVAENGRVGLDLANPYGRTKAMIEHILRDLAAADAGLRVAILRYFNPVGAHSSGLIGEDPKGIPNNLMPYVSQVAQGIRDRVSVFGDQYDTPDGTGVRDYVHVVDLAAGHVAALAGLRPGVEAFNLGTGRGASVLEVIDAFSAVIEHPVPYEIVAPRAGDVASSFADVSKSKDVLGWEAQLTLEDACADAWRWQSGNPDGYGTS